MKISEKTQINCYQVPKTELKSEQKNERLKKLQREYADVNTPGLSFFADVTRKKEFDQKKQEIFKEEEKISCEVTKPVENTKVDKKIDNKTERLPVVQDKPKKNQKTKKISKKTTPKKEQKVIKTASNPPVALPQPALFIDKNNESSTPEDKLNKFKSYYYFYKADLTKKVEVQKRIKNKWQELAVEMAKYRGMPVYEDFIRFSGEEVAPHIK